MLVMGEPSGKSPLVRVSKPNNNNNNKYEIIAELKGHRYGIKLLAILGDFIISIGDENDKGMFIWDSS